MKRLNQSHVALLGLLTLGPMSGYDLKQLSSWSIGHFWREGYGQIYPALKNMTAAGLIRCKTETTPGRPDRHVYSLTPAGRKELNHWLGRPVGNDVPRSELLLKLFFGGLTPLDISREHIAEHRKRKKEALAAYAAIKKRLEKECAEDAQLPFWLMTLSYGECMAEAAVKWCDTTLSALGGSNRARKEKLQMR
jgi:PadR family transcriptional regulator, regulatory protein AphA